MLHYAYRPTFRCTSAHPGCNPRRNADIAAAAGVGCTTLHRYFADREGLVYETRLGLDSRSRRRATRGGHRARAGYRSDAPASYRTRLPEPPDVAEPARPPITDEYIIFLAGIGGTGYWVRLASRRKPASHQGAIGSAVDGKLDAGDIAGLF